MKKFVSEDLANSTVLDSSKGVHLLREAWSKGPAVLVFLRHFM